MPRVRGALYLGRVLSGDGQVTDEPLMLEARDLTTHGVIVGMTGSGKTGLGLILLEEALASGIPVLALDPKGDVTNLALTFPSFRGEDFRPWINESDALREGVTPDEYARSTAETWRKGLEGSGISADDVRAYHDQVSLTIYTPGSLAGVPLNVLGSLAAPKLDWSVHAEVLRDEIQGYVSGLLGLAGVESDPISGREHILLSNLIERAWAAGEDLDLARLVASVQEPPFRKLGVLELESFFPAKDRRALAVRLNGLIASPAFSSWIVGPPIDVGALLAPQGGRTAGAIIYLAHLNEAERQFVVALVLSRVVTWMQSLSGTSDLRTLVYVDELFGFAPPTANPPSKKPILTLMKQARAFGIGMVLATQNPVDLDYKALANAGSWFIGRLQTERDKARLAAGLSSARGDVAVNELEAQIGALGKRQFLLQSAHRSKPERFTTRWAMSYLRGPLTRDQVASLCRDVPARLHSLAEMEALARAAGSGPERRAGSAATGLAENESQVAPLLPPTIPVRYVLPTARWLGSLSSGPARGRLELALAIQATLRFADTRLGISATRDWRGICWPLGETLSDDAVHEVAYEERDFADRAPADAVYVLPAAGVDKPAYFRRMEQALEAYLGRTQQYAVMHQPDLGLSSRPGESREDFMGRCRAAAREAENAEVEKIRRSYDAKLTQADRALSSAEAKVRTLQADVAARRKQEMMGNAGAVLGALLGGRSLTRVLRRAASAMTGASTRRSMTTRLEERLRVAEEKLADAQAAKAALEDELESALSAASARWAEAAERVTEIALPPTRGGVSVHQVTAIWLPR